MKTTKNRTILNLAVIAGLGFSIIQSCGHEIEPVSLNSGSGKNKNTQSPNRPSSQDEGSQSKKLGNQIEGTWNRACEPNKNLVTETLTLKDGKYTHTVASYDASCTHRDDLTVISGTYAIGVAASNVRELIYGKRGFELRPVNDAEIIQIDFTLDEFSQVQNASEGEVEQPKTNTKSEEEIQALLRECPKIQIESKVGQNKFIRNGCESSLLPFRKFDIVTVRTGQLQLGIFIDNLNSFNPSGGTKPELRNNVLGRPMPRGK